MSNPSRWTIFISIAITTVAVGMYHLIPFRLSNSEFRVGRLPHIPTQPIAATVQCNGGVNIRVSDAGRDWSFIRDHPPCEVGGVLLIPVKASASEMLQITRRPVVTFKLSPNGVATEASVIRSSGSKTLDERALMQVRTTRFPHQNCGVCTLSTQSNIDFDGPVWFRDTVPANGIQ